GCGWPGGGIICAVIGSAIARLATIVTTDLQALILSTLPPLRNLHAILPQSRDARFISLTVICKVVQLSTASTLLSSRGYPVSASASTCGETCRPRPSPNPRPPLCRAPCPRCWRWPNSPPSASTPCPAAPLPCPSIRPLSPIPRP